MLELKLNHVSERTPDLQMSCGDFSEIDRVKNDGPISVRR